MDTVSKEAEGNAADGALHPGLDAEVLYTRGMAHYRKREWREAMDCFSQLKALDPNHPGIDALLDELEWFIQLQAIEPGAEAEPGEEPAARPAPRLLPIEEPEPEPQDSRRTARRFPWQSILWVVLALVVVGGVYWLASRPQTDPESELYNRAQAAMARGDYAGAIQAFQEMLTMDPENAGAKVGIENAQRLQQLGILYDQVQNLIKDQHWDEAAAQLKIILQLDSGYKDAAALSQKVETQRTLSALFSQAKQDAESAEWSQAIEKLEQVRSTDPTYNEQEVRDVLFQAYLNDGKWLIEHAPEGREMIQAAIRRFSSALSIRPQDEDAGEQKRLATTLLEASSLYESKSWQAAMLKIKPLYQANSAYAGGSAARILFDCYIGLGDQYRDNKSFTLALDQYRLAKGIDGVDTSIASERERLVLAISVTATPTATRTATPTRTPYHTWEPPMETPVLTEPPPTSVPPPQPTSGPPPPTSPPRPTNTSAPPPATNTPQPTVPPPTSTRPPRK